MKIAAILKFSTLDYPGKLSSVVFCQGCALRCKYCHNPKFLDPSLPGSITTEELLSFLESRIGFLEAVVFSGGEPLLQSDLEQVINAVKSLGYFVGLHTSGICPDEFKQVLPLLDWVGFDIKTCFDSYENITQTLGSGEKASESFEYLLNSGITYEVRTTYDPRNITDTDMINIAKFLKQNGVSRWVIQECITRDNGVTEHLSLPHQIILTDIGMYINVEMRYG
jgi:pyruvate formate lyase activating enzyme